VPRVGARRRRRRDSESGADRRALVYRRPMNDRSARPAPGSDTLRLAIRTLLLALLAPDCEPATTGDEHMVRLIRHLPLGAGVVPSWHERGLAMSVDGNG
jgi:hypothetical protein